MEILNEMPPRNPINGTFELTVRCNLKCKMCLFRHDDSENAEIMANEKTAEEWIDMARQVAEAGTLNLLITGGEPMLRPDFCEIYEGIYKKGFIIELFTNATLVSDKIMDTLRKYPPHKIGVTLYGASTETYEEVCSNGKAFEKALEGINKLITLPSRLEFRTTIIKDNYRDIDNIENIIHDKFGEDKKLIITKTVMKSVRGGNSQAELCRLNPKDNANLMLRRSMKIIKDEVGSQNFDMEKVKFETKKMLNHRNNKRVTLFGCNAGINSYSITWNGKLVGCQLFDKFYSKPFDNSFIDAWNQYPIHVELPKMNSECSNCKYRSRCSICHISVYAETGKFGEIPEYICNCTKEVVKFFNEE